MKKKLLIALGIVVVILAAGFLFITDGLSEGAKVTLNGIRKTVLSGEPVVDMKRFAS